MELGPFDADVVRSDDVDFLVEVFMAVEDKYREATLRIVLEEGLGQHARERQVVPRDNRADVHRLSELSCELMAPPPLAVRSERFGTSPRDNPR